MKTKTIKMKERPFITMVLIISCIINVIANRCNSEFIFNIQKLIPIISIICIIILIHDIIKYLKDKE